MTNVTTVCRCCRRVMVFAEEAAVQECAACGTLNACPRAKGTALDALRRGTEQRLRCDFDNAENSYQHVLLDYPDEHEALWGLALCRYGVEYVEDPATGKRLPVVHGVRSKPMQLDSDFLQACDLAPESVRAQYEAEAAYIDDAMAKICAMAETCPPFDVFICHKTTKPGGEEYTEDYNRAFKLYHMLDKQGYRAFFAPMEMENVSAGSDYEAGIYHALDTARVMLVVCSNADYLNSPWVRNEWRRFFEMKDAGAQKCLLPLMYGEMPPSELPRDFRVRKVQTVVMGEMGSQEKVLGIVRKFAGEKQEAAPVSASISEPAPADIQKPAPADTPQPAAQPQPTSPSTQCKACGHKLVFLNGETAVVCPACRMRNVRAGKEEQARQELAAHKAHAEEVVSRVLPGVPTHQARQVLDTLHTNAVDPANAVDPSAAVRQEKLAELTQVLEAVQHDRQQKQSESCTPERDFTTESASDGVHITRYNGSAREVRIPLRIGGKPVTQIGGEAFRGNTMLEEVSVPEGVTYVGYGAFRECTNLRRIVLPQSASQISANAFQSCRSLQEITLPRGLTEIPKYMLNGCISLREIAVPDRVVRIGESAFDHCAALQSVTLPAGLREIGNTAFYRCFELRHINLPAAVTLGKDVFGQCSNLPASITRRSRTSLVGILDKILPF